MCMLQSRRKLLRLALAAVPASVHAFDAGMKIVVAGAHPGDPECGCGGTIARYADLGHQVVLLYLNRGEEYCNGGKPGECGPIRTAEAERACKLLKARAAFAGQHDGRSIVDDEHYDEFRRVLDVEKPDLLFIHWPLDRHRDHRALSSLALDVWLSGGRKAALYFYEVAADTMMFAPDEFVDISAVEERRRQACFAHASQRPEKWYPEQAALTRSRGIASGYREAEAFLRHWESKRGLLP